MTGLRDSFISYFNKVARLVPASWLINSSRQKFILPFYHAVSDERLPHIDALYRTKTVAEFIKDLDFLLRYFKPIDYVTFKKIIVDKRKISKPVFLLSFDDGLRAFHDIIAPILTKKGIPAICFLNSAFIDNKDLFFKYKASLLVSLIRQKKNIEEPKIKAWISENRVVDLEKWLLSIEYGDKQKLDEFASMIGYNFTDYLTSVQPYLTTVQIEKLIKDGFHFGSHSVDHPEYRFLSFDEQLRQTRESLNFIKNKFSLQYSLFSFPFTDYEVSDRFFQIIFSEKLVDLSFGGAGLKKEIYPLHFQRIAFERDKIPAIDIYKAESLYSAALNIFGKNVVKRR